MMTLSTLGAEPRGHYRAVHVARAELAKITSLRSTTITLGFTVLAAVVVTALVSHAQLHHVPPGSDNGFDPTATSLSGMIVVALTSGVFGALLVTGEYSSGTMRSTLAATPVRPTLLATKIVVAAALMLVFCEALSVVCFLLGQGILGSGGTPTASLGSPGAARAVFMTGAFVTLLCLMAFGFGFVFRNTAAAIAAFVGVVFVLPLVMHSISQAAVAYLPPNILAQSIMATVRQAPPGAPNAPLSPAVGLAVMVLYAAVALVAGAAVFCKRDA